LLIVAIAAGKARQVADWGRGWLNVLDGLNRLFCHRYHRLDSTLLDLPERGGAIIAANHVSGLDALLLIAASPRPVRFLIAREEYERFGLQWLLRAVGCIPVDREARPEAGLRNALRALESGEVVVIFPHGRIHLDDHPPRALKRGVVFLAQKTASPVYPVRIDGIGLPGHTILSVPVRSRAQLTCGVPLRCAGAEADCLELIRAYLERRYTAGKG
jgi:1-acyl-sn-glycerol-3-phosphate acyltransferase